MLVCTAEWEPVEIANEAVALNDLVALCLATRAVAQSMVSHPRGVEELLQLLRDTGLDNLLQLSQLSIITMGNQRHCSERRAEAIMSAIGATDWFHRIAKD
jgi:hypothetical protein